MPSLAELVASGYLIRHRIYEQEYLGTGTHSCDMPRAYRSCGNETSVRVSATSRG